MIDWVIKFVGPWNGWIAFLVYWLPLSFCVVGYTLRTVRRVREDAKERDKEAQKSGYYHPRETVGHIVGRAVVTVLPGVNMWAAVFSIAPDFFGRFFKWIGTALDQPLVPQYKKDNGDASR